MRVAQLARITPSGCKPCACAFCSYAPEMRCHALGNPRQHPEATVWGQGKLSVALGTPR